MMISKTKRGYDFVKEREKESQRLQTLEMLKKDDFMKRQTNWQVRTDAWVLRTQVEREAHKMRQDAEAQLNERRRQLALLLDREDQMYKNEIISSQQTTSDRQKLIVERAIQLRTEREAKQRQIAAEAYERQFRLQSDELRTKESQIRAWKIAHGGRMRQLEENQQRTVQEQEEEKKWAELWEKDRLRKEYREQLDQEDIKSRNKEMKTLLDIQVKDNVYFQDGDQSKGKEADKKLLQQWQKEYQEYEQGEKDKKINLYHQLNNNNQYNQTIVHRKINDEVQEKQQDKQLVNNLLSKEKDAIDKELEHGQRLKSECKKDYFLTMNRRAQDDTENKERERYINEQQKIVHDKEDEEREKQRLYRENLLRDVLSERGEQVKDKERMKLELKQFDKQYADQLKKRIAEEEGLEREKQRLIYQKNLQTRDLLFRQVEVDHDRENKEKQYDLALYKRMLEVDKKYKEEEERILQTDVPEDVYYGVKHANFYS